MSFIHHTKENQLNPTKFCISVSIMALLAACGGGSGGGNTNNTNNNTSNNNQPQSIPSASVKLVKGVAATGAAISGIVYAYDIDGKASPIANINADGTYEVDVDGLTPPLMITTIGVSNLKPAIYHSIATSSDIDKNVNVTPLTEVVLAYAAGRPAADIVLADMPTVVTQIPAAVTQVKNIVAPLTAAVGATITNPLTDTFSANGTGMDKVLDNINVMPAKQGGTIDVRLVGNNVSLGTVTLPAAAGQAAIATASTAVTPLHLTNAQKLATAIADANVCMASLTSLYATTIPTASALQVYFDPSFKSWGGNRTWFVNYFTTPAPNGRGEIGMKWVIGAVADYDFTPPTPGTAATTALPAPVTYDVNGNITAMWVIWGGAQKMIKGAAYTGCPSGWMFQGNRSDFGDLDITQAYFKNVPAGTITRSLNVRLALGDINAVEPTATTVVVTGPGFATSVAGAAPSAQPSITLVRPGLGSVENTMLISGQPNMQLPYCQDINVSGTLCFDETKVAAGTLYKWSARNTVMLREWVYQFSKSEATWAQIRTHADRIFPAITTHTATASWLATLNGLANGATVPSYSINFTSGSLADKANFYGNLRAMDSNGVALQYIQNPASFGTYSTDPAATKSGTYVNASQVWGTIDDSFMGALVSTGTFLP